MAGAVEENRILVHFIQERLVGARRWDSLRRCDHGTRDEHGRGAQQYAEEASLRSRVHGLSPLRSNPAQERRCATIAAAMLRKRRTKVGTRRLCPRITSFTAPRRHRADERAG